MLDTDKVKRRPEPEFLNSSLEIDSKKSIPPAYVPILAGRYDNPNPTRFLAPIDCFKNSTTVQ